MAVSAKAGGLADLARSFSGVFGFVQQLFVPLFLL